mmetsp:Transcript_16316/g.24023  ORF Transcript_16316/g.24023 Transcript_16316/m.24023 type:complete len:208 (-) Transcript_16316:23-646(-)
MHLGDVANRGNLKDIRSFTKWLKTQQRKQQYYVDVVIIEGNHDRNIRHPHLMDLRYEYQQADDDDDHRRVHFLQHQAVDVVKNRLRLYGASWNSCQRNQFSLEDDILPKVPDGRVDILLTHVRPGVKSSRTSDVCLLFQLTRQLKVPCHVFGHTHRERGVSVGRNTVSINCATSAATGLPVVVDFCPKLRRVTMAHCPLEERCFFYR